MTELCWPVLGRLLVVAFTLLGIGPRVASALQPHPCGAFEAVRVGPAGHHHGEPTTASATPQWTGPVSDCPSCQHTDCAAGQHCAAGAVVALPPDPALLWVTDYAARPESGVTDRPLSANPTPPNPPPQPVLSRTRSVSIADVLSWTPGSHETSREDQHHESQSRGRRFGDPVCRLWTG
jgi:hypothetical protein